MIGKRGALFISIAAGYLLIAAIHPFEFSRDFSERLGPFFMGFVTAPRAWSEAFYTRVAAEKFLLYVPGGFLLYYALASPRRPRRVTILLAAIWAGLIGFLMEFSQVFLPGRHPSSPDVLIKGLGGACGALVAGICAIQIPKQTHDFWQHVERSTVPIVAILLYGALPSILFMARYPWLDFGNWDARFPLQIGNEATLDRPWLGKIYLAALYNRALSADEVARHFHLGPSPEAFTRRGTEGLVVFYPFSEGSGHRVHDFGPSGTPIHLTFSPDSAVRWLDEANGIDIQQPAILKSQGPAEKLVAALSAASALSIEVWISPRDTVQQGPARIVALSRDTRGSNFVLGQHGADLHFRLRTPILGRSGTAVPLTSRDILLPAETFHIVATYHEGIEKLYVNGSERSGGLDVARDTMVGLAARKSPAAQIAYSYVYFFPVSFFPAIFFSTRFRGVCATVLLPIAIGVGFLSLTEILQAYALERTLELPLIGYGILIGTVGAFSGVAFAKRR